MKMYVNNTAPCIQDLPLNHPRSAYLKESVISGTRAKAQTRQEPWCNTKVGKPICRSLMSQTWKKPGAPRMLLSILALQWRWGRAPEANRFIHAMLPTCTLCTSAASSRTPLSPVLTQGRSISGCFQIPGDVVAVFSLFSRKRIWGNLNLSVRCYNIVFKGNKDLCWHTPELVSSLYLCASWPSCSRRSLPP